MPLKDGSLTAQEAQFAGYMAATGDAKYSAAKAGYSKPEIVGYAKASNPALASVIRKAQVARLNSTALTASVDLLERVILDNKETTRNRITAAQTVLKYSLGGRDGDDAKEPHEMTPAELQARIDQLRRTLADKARPVIEHEPEPPKGDVFG